MMDDTDEDKCKARDWGVDTVTLDPEGDIRIFDPTTGYKLWISQAEVDYMVDLLTPSKQVVDDEDFEMTHFGPEITARVDDHVRWTFDDDDYIQLDRFDLEHGVRLLGGKVVWP